MQSDHSGGLVQWVNRPNLDFAAERGRLFVGGGGGGLPMPLFFFPWAGGGLSGGGLGWGGEGGGWVGCFRGGGGGSGGGEAGGRFSGPGGMALIRGLLGGGTLWAGGPLFFSFFYLVLIRPYVVCIGSARRSGARGWASGRESTCLSPHCPTRRRRIALAVG